MAGDFLLVAEERRKRRIRPALGADPAVVWRTASVADPGLCLALHCIKVYASTGGPKRGYGVPSGYTRAMPVSLKPDFPVTNDACKQATGKTLDEWAEVIGKNPEIATKRREAIQLVADTTGRSVEGIWWATTIWVEYEKRNNRVQKDGRPEGYNICCTKSITAPVEKIQKALESEFKNVTRVRDGKDIRAVWRTDGVDFDTDVDVTMTSAGNKVALALMHKRIETRDEADGLRNYWTERLASIKSSLEG